MEFDFVSLIQDLGPALALLGYFVYKDWKFTGQILALMAKIETYLDVDRNEQQQRSTTPAA